MSLLRYIFTLVVTCSFVVAHYPYGEPHFFPFNRPFGNQPNHGFTGFPGFTGSGGSSGDSQTLAAQSSSTTDSGDAATTTFSSQESQETNFSSASDENFGGQTTSTDASDATATSSSQESQDSSSSGSTGGSDSELVLDANLVQSASDSNGDASEEAGQSPSLTDPANFINFCGTSGQQLTNGTQNVAGSCNGIPMGEIPSKDNMISTIIMSPQTGQTIPANQPFNVSVQINNLVAGNFTNPNTTYYAAPQFLQDGKIVGHTHITIQQLDSLNGGTPPDPTTFAFFKGINDDGNGDGGLSAEVTDGLPAGFYRICTMTSAANHQPVTMPVAQRGAQDDCNKVTVSDNGSTTDDSAETQGEQQQTSESNVQIGTSQMGGRRVRRRYVA